MLGRSTKRRVAFPLAVLLAGALVLGAPRPSRAGASTLRTRLLLLINAARERSGVAPLRLAERLSDDAERHTRAMIRRDRLFHTEDLASVLRPYRWRVSGEVVGCALRLHGLVRAWLGSPEHRSILLDPRFRRVGLGPVASREGRSCGPGLRVWATAILYG